MSTPATDYARGINTGTAIGLEHAADDIDRLLASDAPDSVKLAVIADQAAALRRHAARMREQVAPVETVGPVMVGGPVDADPATIPGGTPVSDAVESCSAWLTDVFSRADPAMTSHFTDASKVAADTWPELLAVNAVSDDTLSYAYYADETPIELGDKTARIEVSSDVNAATDEHETVMFIRVGGSGYFVADPADYAEKVSAAAAVHARLQRLIADL